MAAILLTSYGNIAHFSLALTGFLLVDHASWLYMRRFFRSSIDKSRTYYSTERKFYEVEVLSMVESQVFGRWKLWRLAVGAAIVIAADLFAFNQAFREVTASAVQAICPWLSTRDAITLFYSILFPICPVNGTLDLVASDPAISSPEYVRGSQRAISFDASIARRSRLLIIFLASGTVTGIHHVMFACLFGHRHIASVSAVQRAVWS